MYESFLCKAFPSHNGNWCSHRNTSHSIWSWLLMALVIQWNPPSCGFRLFTDTDSADAVKQNRAANDLIWGVFFTCLDIEQVRFASVTAVFTQSFHGSTGCWVFNKKKNQHYSVTAGYSSTYLFCLCFFIMSEPTITRQNKCEGQGNSLISKHIEQ